MKPGFLHGAKLEVEVKNARLGAERARRRSHCRRQLLTLFFRTTDTADMECARSGCRWGERAQADGLSSSTLGLFQIERVKS